MFCYRTILCFIIFCCTDTPTPEIYTLSLHDALPISREELQRRLWPSDTFVDFDHSLNTAIMRLREALGDSSDNPRLDRKSTRLNSSHRCISYAVFCLKKKTNNKNTIM